MTPWRVGLQYPPFSKCLCAGYYERTLLPHTFSSSSFVRLYLLPRSELQAGMLSPDTYTNMEPGGQQDLSASRLEAQVEAEERQVGNGNRTSAADGYKLGESGTGEIASGDSSSNNKRHATRGLTHHPSVREIENSHIVSSWGRGAMLQSGIVDEGGDAVAEGSVASEGIDNLSASPATLQQPSTPNNPRNVSPARVRISGLMKQSAAGTNSKYEYF